MAQAPINFKPISWASSNPFLTAYNQLQQMKQTEADTRKQQIMNQYLPQTLADKLKQMEAQTSELPTEDAYKKALTNQLNAEIPFIPTKYAAMQFRMNNPLLGVSGVGQQLGVLLYMRQHPELFAKNTAGGINSTGTPSTSSVPTAPLTTQGRTPSTFPITSGAPNVIGTTPNINIAQGKIPQTSQDFADILTKSIGSQQRQQNARATYYDTMSASLPFRQLGSDVKNSLIAQAQGMGYAPQEATRLFMSGKSIYDLAKDQGLDPNNMPPPIYVTTKASLNQIQQRQQALAEINKIVPLISSAIKPYSRRFLNFSPLQISDALKGENEDKQAKYLAARALQPELSLMRSRAMMGRQAGIETINEITDKSMGKIKIFQSLVSPAVYKKTQDYIDDWINKGITAANKVNMAPFKTRKAIENQKQQPIAPLGSSTNTSSMVRMQAPDGKIYRVPADKVDVAIKEGKYKRL